MRLIFMGTPEFSVQALDALHKAGHEIVAVYSQPPKPVGRGHKVVASPVQKKAEALGLPVFTPKSLRKPEPQAEFAAHKADLAVVVAYGLILPKEILEAPRLGCVNIDASLLPRWRGAAPIQRAILAGDAETGITIMQMDEGLDTGAMLMVEHTPITELTTTPMLHDALAVIGARMIVVAAAQLAAGALPPTAQPEAGVTYAAKLTKDESVIDWNMPAQEIMRKINGLSPWPGVSFVCHNEVIKLQAAELVKVNAPVGTIMPDAVIACAEGGLRLVRVQRPNKAAVDGIAFINGLRLNAGDKLI